MIQALWPLDQSNLERASGGALFDLPTLAQFVDRGSDVPGDSFDPDVLTRTNERQRPLPLRAADAGFDAAQTLAFVNHFTLGCSFKRHKCLTHKVVLRPRIRSGSVVVIRPRP